jgi:hypothetical protein
MLTTGNQLKAARALLGMDQILVAHKAGLNVNTIRNMEAAGHAAVAGRAENVQVIQRLLEEHGIEFLNHGQPGVRLKVGFQPPTPAPEFDPFGGKGGFQTQVGEPRRPRPRPREDD